MEDLDFENVDVEEEEKKMPRVKNSQCKFCVFCNKGKCMPLTFTLWKDGECPFWKSSAKWKLHTIGDGVWEVVRKNNL